MADQESQGGLSYVSDGAPAPAESQLIPTRTTIQVGGSKFPVAAGIDSSTILKNLQEEMDRRQAAMPSDFMHGLTKAAAFSLGRPDVAASVDAQRQNQLNQLYNMRMQGEAFRAAQAQQERAMQGFSSENPNAIPAAPSLGQGQGAAPNLGQGQGAVPNLGAAPVQGLDQYSGIPNNIKRELYAQTQAEIAQGADPIQATAKYHASLNKLRDELVKSATDYAHNPAIQTPQDFDFYDANTGTVVKRRMPISEYNSYGPYIDTPTGKLYKSDVGLKLPTATNVPPPPTVPAQAAVPAATPAQAAVPAQAAAPAKPVKFSANATYGTPPKLLDNLGLVESSNDPYAMNTSTKALGKYQFTPETLVTLHKQGVEFNPLNPDQARAAADFYISQLAAKHGGDYAAAMKDYGGFKDKDSSAYVGKVLNGVVQNQPTANTPVVPSVSLPNIEPQIKSYADEWDRIHANEPASQDKNTRKQKALEDFRKQVETVGTKAAEENITLGTEAEKAMRKKGGEWANDFITHTIQNQDRLAQVNRLIDLVKEHPNDFGWQQRTLGSGSVAGLLSGIVGVGSPTVADRALTAGSMLSSDPGVASRRSEADALAKDIGTSLSSEAVKNARVGLGLVNMVQAGKGLGTALHPATNLENLYRIQNIYARENEQADALAQYLAANPGANPAQFKSSAINKAIEAKYNNDLVPKRAQLRSDFPEHYGLGTKKTTGSLTPEEQQRLEYLRKKHGTQ